MSNWKHENELFTSNIIGIPTSNGEVITKDYLEINDPDSFEVTLMLPVGGDSEKLVSLIHQEKLTYHRDGSMEREYTYHTFPKYSVGQVHMLSPIGRKMIYNHLIDTYGKENVKEIRKEQ